MWDIVLALIVFPVSGPVHLHKTSFIDRNAYAGASIAVWFRKGYGNIFTWSDIDRLK